MKYLLFIFVFSFSIQAQENLKTKCPLSKEKRFKLIKSSPHWVDDIKCINDKYYRWYISNTKAIYPNIQIGNELAKKKIISHTPSNTIKKKEKTASSSRLTKQRGLNTKQQRSPAQTSPSNEKPKQILDNDETGIFDFGIGLGGKYYSHSQSGALGSANVGALFLNNISLFTSYEKRKFKLETQAYIYKFKYDVSSSSTEKQLYSYSLKSYYRNLFFAVTFEQQPLFKNSGSEVDMVAESTILPNLGYSWKIELSKKIETRLLIQASVSYLMNSSASDTKIKISEQKGYGVDLKTRLTRQLHKSKRFPIYYYWSNDIGYRDYQRSVEWGTSTGVVESKHLHFNSTIGLKVEF